MSSSSSILEGAYRVIQSAVDPVRAGLKLTSSQVNKLQEFAYESLRNVIASGKALDDKQLMNQLCIFVAKQAVSQGYIQVGQKIVEELLKLDSYEKAVDFLRYVSWMFDVVYELIKNNKEDSRPFLESIKKGNLDEFLIELTKINVSEKDSG